jgi:hypothetical protein
MAISVVQFLVSIDPSGHKTSDGPISTVHCSELHWLALHGRLEKNAPKCFDLHVPYSPVYYYVMKGIQSAGWFLTCVIEAISRKLLGAER